MRILTPNYKCYKIKNLIKITGFHLIVNKITKILIKYHYNHNKINNILLMTMMNFQPHIVVIFKIHWKNPNILNNFNQKLNKLDKTHLNNHNNIHLMVHLKI